MLQLQHNIVTLLYTIKAMIDAHFAQVAEGGRFVTIEDRLRHAEGIMKKAQLQSERALLITRRLGGILKSGQRSGRRGSRVCVETAWRYVIALLKKEFAADAIEVIERIPAHFPFVACERDDFYEILYNLAKNAVQAMVEMRADSVEPASPAGGRIADSGNQGNGGDFLTAKRYTLYANKLIIRVQMAFNHKEESFAVITLSDTGPGIAGKKLSWLFQPFFTTKDENEGSGLGLYLTQKLVTKNGGRITVSSFNGCGTTFTLEFPLAVRVKK